MDTLGYTGEIRLYAGLNPPANWQWCNGRVYHIADYDDLFNLIGNTYGGDGSSTFALPDLQGRVPLHQGPMPGGPTYPIGHAAGAEGVALTPDQMPRHTHTLKCATDNATTNDGANNYLATSQGEMRIFYEGSGTDPMAQEVIAAAGNENPHNNLQPYLCINYMICVQGNFPPQ